MEKRRVVITGLGTVNPLGNNTADSWAAAKAGKCGIGPITQFDTADVNCKLAGEVREVLGKSKPQFPATVPRPQGSGTGGHPLSAEGHVHLPGDGLRRRHQCRRRCLPPHP